MHHGYYPGGKVTKTHKEHQIDMIDESLKWAGVDGSKVKVRARPPRARALAPHAHACTPLPLPRAGTPRCRR